MSSGSDYPGSEFLRGESPREILGKLFEGDPLGLAAKSMARLRERALLIQPDRLFVATLARTAYSAAWGYEGDPPLDQWLAEHINQTIDQIIEQDLAGELKGVPPDEAEAEYYAWVAAAAAAEPSLARRLCLVFNGLSRNHRVPFFEVVVSGKSVEQFAMETDTPPHRVQSRIEETIRMMVQLADQMNDGLELEEEGP